MKNKKLKGKKLPKLKLVRFDYGNIPVEYYDEYPFNVNLTYIMLGEINHMPGHCVVMEFLSGKLYAGYHTENFVELTEEEV